MCVVPLCEQAKFPPERLAAKRYKNSPSAFGLQGEEEAFDDGDAPVFADLTKARLGPFAATPGLEGRAPKLLPLIANDVLWNAISDPHRASQESTHVL